jgi:hypothetical protein
MAQSHRQLWIPGRFSDETAADGSGKKRGRIAGAPFIVSLSFNQESEFHNPGKEQVASDADHDEIGQHH